MESYFTIGFNKEEKQELLNLLKDSPKWLERISGSFGTLVNKVQPFIAGDDPLFHTTFYENYNGEFVGLNDFHYTGICPSWEDAKKSPNSLPTIGYFYNQDGKLCDASRFSFYLKKEVENFPIRFENTGEHLGDQFNRVLLQTYNT